MLVRHLDNESMTLKELLEKSEETDRRLARLIGEHIDDQAAWLQTMKDLLEDQPTLG